MNRKLLRGIATLLTIVIMTLSFVGCADEPDGSKVDIGYISGNYQMIIDSVDKINCDYLLVYRSTASYAEIDAFVDFLETLSTSTTATFQICPDTLNITDANQKIILLGNTGYDESIKSKEIMERIRSNNYYDYLLRGYDNTLSVTWMSKFGREDAFNYILTNLLNNSFDTAFTSNYSYMYLSDRTDTPVVTIDDINIIQYSVVMAASPSYIERNCAEALVTAIENATGVKVPLVTDDVEESKYEILVGNTNRGETYVTQFFATKRYAVAQYNTKLILRGGQIEATSKAVAEFTKQVEKASITAEPLHIKANYCSTGSLSTYGGDYFDGYELVFSDEFNAKDINTETWNIESGAIVGYGDTATLMYFNPKNVKSNGSEVVIRTDLTDEGYRSGHITTEDSFSFKYGYAEARVSFRTCPGMWIKMILTNQNDNDKNITQIDVFNSLGSTDSVFASAGTLPREDYYTNYLKFNEHTYEANRTGALSNGKSFVDEEYHTFGVEWTPEYIRYFIDGVSYGTVEVSSDKYKNLNTEMYLDFMCGVNLTEQVANDEVAMWPINLTVDWVRVYQRKDGVHTDRTLVVEAPEETPEQKPATKK